MACADLNPRFVCARTKNVENALPPGGVAEEVLSHALSSHAGAECSNAAQSDANKSSRAELLAVDTDRAEGRLDEAETFRYRFLSFEG
jgi:hypothetical protein